MFFEANKIYYYLFVFSFLAIVNYFAANVKKSWFEKDSSADEYKIIQQYLLNDSPLYGYNRPKLWIHSQYARNARQWDSFSSRSNTGLNQPYLHLTIKSIINHCGDDFNVCLIDDDSFSKLIPVWNIDITSLADPMKSRARELGMLYLLHYYGGILVPNSFLCVRNLKNLFDTGTANNTPFVCEHRNRGVTPAAYNGKKLGFVPDIRFMGARKNDVVVKDMMDSFKKQFPFTNHKDDRGTAAAASGFHATENPAWAVAYCLDAIRAGRIALVDGSRIGIKTNKRKAVLIEHLLEDGFLDLPETVDGIWIPAEEILTRTKYAWFAVLSSEEILTSNTALKNYFAASIVDSERNSNNSLANTYAPKSILSI